MFRLLPLLSLCLGLLMLAGCSGRKPYPNRPITVVCPWAAGGGTDRVSRQLAMHLENELHVPVNVINATGGKGVTGHSRSMLARPDGYTVGVITLELNMMHFSGLTDLTYHDCIPLISVNEDYAALFVRKDAEWASLQELTEDIKTRPGELQASGTAAGGAWHLAMAGWLLSCDLDADDVVWVSSTGANPSLQELMSGGVDMVCCSLPEADSLYRSGEVRAIGVMSPKRVSGYEDVATFREQGSDWTLGGWRGVAVPLKTPPEVVDKLVTTLRRIVTGKTHITLRRTDDNGQAEIVSQTFPEFMAREGFDNTWRGPDDFREFLAETDEKFGKLLTSEAMASVNTDRYRPMTFPWILIGLLAIIGLAMAARGQFSSDDPDHPAPFQLDSRAAVSIAAVVAAISAYALFAESVGFLLMGFVVLLALLLWLGNRPTVSVLIALVFIPAAYVVFGHLMRVPLPRGWLS